jgi:hypothetical protein
MTGKLLVLLLMLLPLVGAKCPGIPETKDMTITIVTEEQMELLFVAQGSVNVDSDVETINTEDIRDDLLDAGLTQEDIEAIETITVEAVEYGTVTYNEPATDREIVDIDVTVWRVGAEADSALLVSDFSTMVHPLLGILVPAPIEPSGIDWINDLLEEVLEAIKDESGSTNFSVMGRASGQSEPMGRETDFTWRLVISYQIPSGFPVEVIDI